MNPKPSDLEAVILFESQAEESLRPVPDATYSTVSKEVDKLNVSQDLTDFLKKLYYGVIAYDLRIVFEQADSSRLMKLIRRASNNLPLTFISRGEEEIMERGEPVHDFEYILPTELISAHPKKRLAHLFNTEHQELGTYVKELIKTGPIRIGFNSEALPRIDLAEPKKEILHYISENFPELLVEELNSCIRVERKKRELKLPITAYEKAGLIPLNEQTRILAEALHPVYREKENFSRFVRKGLSPKIESVINAEESMVKHLSGSYSFVPEEVVKYLKKRPFHEFKLYSDIGAILEDSEPKAAVLAYRLSIPEGRELTHNNARRIFQLLIGHQLFDDALKYFQSFCSEDHSCFTKTLQLYKLGRHLESMGLYPEAKVAYARAACRARSSPKRKAILERLSMVPS